MRSTWILVAVLIAGGVMAWLSLSSDSGGDSETGNHSEAGDQDAFGGGGTARPGPKSSNGVSLKRDDSRARRVASPAKPSASDAVASGLVAGIAKAREAGDKELARRLEAELRTKAWDAPAARRYALGRGRQYASAADQEQDRERKMRLYDQARRLLSRGLFLPEMFNPDTTDTATRADLKTRIRTINRRVMTYQPGLPGVTARYEIASGIRPVQIVARNSQVGEGNILTIFDPGGSVGQQLSLGPNALMYWNQGNLKPTSMRAGAQYLIPLEELTLHVHQRVYRLAIYVGDWFVKEFRVGVGQRDTPTPSGEFKVDSKEENPDWWRNGQRIPFGDPKNELGSRWIAVHGDDLPLAAGIGIHGTNKPRTVGTRCSNGCVRLKNAEVNELFWWVRTAYNGGQATRIFILP